MVGGDDTLRAGVRSRFVAFLCFSLSGQAFWSHLMCFYYGVFDTVVIYSNKAPVMNAFVFIGCSDIPIGSLIEEFNNRKKTPRSFFGRK